MDSKGIGDGLVNGYFSAYRYQEADMKAILENNHRLKTKYWY
ncbi:hypothetical protein ACFLTL_00225 [Chloroflexota bacterium]